MDNLAVMSKRADELLTAINCIVHLVAQTGSNSDLGLGPHALTKALRCQDKHVEVVYRIYRQYGKLTLSQIGYPFVVVGHKLSCPVLRNDEWCKIN